MTRGACRGDCPVGDREKTGRNVACLTMLEPPPVVRFGRRRVCRAGAIPLRDGKVGEVSHTPRREKVGRREAVHRPRRGEEPATHVLVALKSIAKHGDREAQLAERVGILEGDRLSRRVHDDVQHLGDVAQDQRATLPIAQPLFQLPPIHRTSPHRYSAVDPRDNPPPVATSASRANSAFIRDRQGRVNR